MRHFINSLCAFLFALNVATLSLAFVPHHIERKNLIFTDAQMKIINDKNLSELIAQLISHKTILLYETDLLLDFATQVSDSGFPFARLQKRIEGYIKKGLLPFAALTKAIDREQMKKWRAEKLANLKQKNDDFARKIHGFNLKPANKDKILEAYALCVDAFRNSEERERWLTPKVCEPIPGFNKLRNHHSEQENDEEDPDCSPKFFQKRVAYNALIEETAHVAKTENLDDFEKIKMAKCISEHALRFFSAYQRPLKALKRVCQYHQEPAKAFFAHQGVCGNFAAIAYNIANAIGLEGRVYMARRKLHTYIEFQSGGSWYHSHPFNSTANSCDVVRFQPGPAL